MNQTKTTPKDFFLHVGATISLYIAAGALINLSFSVINYFRPDVLAGSFYGNSVAWPISILVVLVPLFYVLEWLINRDIQKMPEKADLPIRKWRMYLTLFLAVVLVGGDLIALINVYLNGEITSRFVYKVIAILLISTTIAKYYFFTIYSSFRWAKNIRRIHAWLGIVLVLVAIIAGFIAVGSPTKQRGLRADSLRINDLSTIQYQVLNYWQNKQKLPASLVDLNDTISGFIVPTDLESKAAYEYSIKPATTTQSSKLFIFELCATFAQPSQDNRGRGASYGRGGIYPAMMVMSYPYPGGQFETTWEHEAGRSCFTRTIDPEKYPVNPKPLPM